MDIRTLLYNGTPLQHAFLEAVAAALGRPVDSLAPFEGRTIRDLYVEGICGGAVIPLGEAGRPPQDIHVPLSHQSALAGILLAAALIRSALGGDPPGTTATRIDVLHAVGTHLAQPVRARRDGRCLCDDHHTRTSTRPSMPRARSRPLSHDQICSRSDDCWTPRSPWTHWGLPPRLRPLVRTSSPPLSTTGAPQEPRMGGDLSRRSGRQQLPAASPGRAWLPRECKWICEAHKHARTRTRSIRQRANSSYEDHLVWPLQVSWGHDPGSTAEAVLPLVTGRFRRGSCGAGWCARLRGRPLVRQRGLAGPGCRCGPAGLVG